MFPEIEIKPHKTDEFVHQISINSFLFEETLNFSY